MPETTEEQPRRPLTAAQRRRAKAKVNQAESDRVKSGLGRFGRLRRRYDRKDQREVKARGARLAAFVRGLRSAPTRTRIGRKPSGHGMTRQMRAIRGPQPRLFHDSSKGPYRNPVRDINLSKRARRRGSRGRAVSR